MSHSFHDLTSAVVSPPRCSASVGDPTTDASSKLTWSCSQQRTLDDCPRARYWASEQAPQGWRADASELARVAYRLKSLTTLAMEAGRTLHERAAERARALQDGGPMPTLSAMRQRSATHMRHVWISSRDRFDAWLRDPKHVPMLADRYYGRGPTQEQACAVRERLERGLTALDALGLWAEVAACRPEDVLVVDALSSYVLPHPEGVAPVTVWAAPDLVMRVEPDGPWELVDYKTERVQDGAPFRAAIEQVQTYAVYLRHGARVLGPDEACRGRLVLLSDGTEHEFSIAAEEIDAAERRIRTGALAMAQLRARADTAATAALEAAARSGASVIARVTAVERARRTAYPMTQNRTLCQRCRFLELCVEELEAGDAPGGDSTEVG